MKLEHMVVLRMPAMRERLRLAESVNGWRFVDKAVVGTPLDPSLVLPRAKLLSNVMMGPCAMPYT
jgi:hypothetical protein